MEFSSRGHAFLYTFLPPQAWNVQLVVCARIRGVERAAEEGDSAHSERGQ